MVEHCIHGMSMTELGLLAATASCSVGEGRGVKSKHLTFATTCSQELLVSAVNAKQARGL